MNQYSRKIEFDEIKDLEYDILKEFDKFAQENNIKYFMCGGTCLGAIRHKDFIPWDDDIDICLCRKDYDKLMKLAREYRKLPNKPEYKFLLPLDDNYVYPYVKVVNSNTVVYEKNIQTRFATGVWIDIFPMDIWPDDKRELKKIMIKHRFYKMMNKVYIAGNISNTKQKIVCWIGKLGYAILFHGKDYKYWISRIMDLNQPCEGKYVGNRMWPVKDKEFFTKSVFSNTIYTLFRDEKFPVPVGYEEYLTKMYGDYMKLPKPEDRVFHDFLGYIKK